MSAMLGADTRRIDVVAEGLRGYSQEIEDLRTTAQRAVAEMRNVWGGPDFERIAERWEQEASPRLTNVSSALAAMASTLRTQAEAQRLASGDTWGSTAPVVRAAVPDGLAGRGTTNGGAAGGGGGGGGGSGWGLLEEAEETHGNDPNSSTYINGHKVDVHESTSMDVAGSGTTGATFAHDLRENVNVNLANGDVSAEAALASVKGGNRYGEYELAAGKAESDAGYSLDLDANGNVVASASAGAGAYLGYAAGKVRVGSETLNIGAAGKADIGAEAKADASGSIGLDGVNAHAGGEVFAGGKVETNVSGTAAGVTASAGAEVSYGIGAHAEGDAEISATSVGVSLDLGATLGMGGGFSFDVSVNPQEVIATVGNVVDGLEDGLGDAADAEGGFLSW